ncbi:unnamed protein product [Rotaria magnacalcarata]|uniref:Uncharacterized protein n=2 Tax=Rotaria magnacalcarata TaxID=392030 RepID=A0A816X6V0_9BILA|nr:unnamed protein product [Rotaria magnacalcarata]
MGGSLSSNKGYNRVLARQLPASISMPRFEIKNDLVQPSSPDSLKIPVPMRFAQNEIQTENPTTAHVNRLSFLNTHPEYIQTMQQSNVSPPIQSTIASSPINHPMKNKSRHEQSQQQIIKEDTSHFVKTDSSTYDQATNGDVAVIPRSVTNRNDPRYFENHLPSSFQPQQSIIEHKGRKFLVETKHRTERRYVECMDDKTHRLRYFEVVDCVPIRTVRPYTNQSRSILRHDTFHPNFRSNNHSDLSQTSRGQSKAALPSSFNVKQNSQSPPFGLNTSKFSDYGLPSSSANNYLNSYEETETKRNEEINRAFRSSEIPDGYQRIDPSFFTQQNSTAVSNGDYKWATAFNPFAESIYPSHQDQYSQQFTTKNDAESTMNNQKPQPSTYSEYAQTAITRKLSHQPLHSYPKDLFTKI